MKREIVKAGDRALLVQLGEVSSDVLHAAARAVREAVGVIACIPGHQSLLVVFRDAPVPAAIELALAIAWGRAIEGIRHDIRVNFDATHALDLHDLLARAGLSKVRFLSQLEGVSLSARYLGFRPGFAYLDGWPEEWSLPRRATSRNLVPRGSFAIAGSMAGFYPLDSPGGWNVLGRTSATLWSAQREPPNLIAPGDRVRVVSVEDDPGSAQPPPMMARSETADRASVAQVIAAGQLTLIVGARDWSRAQYGVPPGGPFDGEAMSLANLAAGNHPLAAALECVLVGPRLRFTESRAVAWCNGVGEVERRRVDAGEELDIGRFPGGVRGYLAIEGGFHDPRTKFAEAPVRIRAGDLLQSSQDDLLVGADASRATLRVVEVARRERLEIRIARGPHHAPPVPEEWQVSRQMDRVGIRLLPLVDKRPALPADLLSCGMQFGTLQWHPDGSLVALGPDHPVTGGYLQPATVVTEDLWKLGQLAPGERVRLLAI